jgi:microcystin-dependent protein
MAVKRYSGAAWVVEAGGNPGLPSGMLAPFAGTTAPSGWELCYGQAVSRTAYANLFAVVGTTYGTGDGSTTFNLPDLRGRAVAGIDNMGGTDAGRLDIANTAGTVTGSQYVTLTSAQSGIPAHNHGVTDPGHVHSANGRTDSAPTASGFGGVSSAIRASYNSYTLDNQLVTVYSNTTGITINNNTAANASAPHDNMPPTMIMNYIIKT